MTTTASGATIQPIVPPRAVNVPTFRRSDPNSGTVGGAAAARLLSEDVPGAERTGRDGEG